MRNELFLLDLNVNPGICDFSLKYLLNDHKLKLIQINDLRLKCAMVVPKV